MLRFQYSRWLNPCELPRDSVLTSEKPSTSVLTLFNPRIIIAWLIVPIRWAQP